MISYVIGDNTEQDLILTLHENQTISEPIYSFLFVHVLSKVAVQFIKNTNDDKSFFPDRFNQFTILPGQLFTEPGEWHYKVIEQQTGVILEEGILLMKKANEFNITRYSPVNGFTAYKG